MSVFAIVYVCLVALSFIYKEKTYDTAAVVENDLIDIEYLKKILSCKITLEKMCFLKINFK